MNKTSTAVEPEKRGAGPRSGWTGESPVTNEAVPTHALSEPMATAPTQTDGGLTHGWGSRLRSYFIFNPLIWAYTIVLGTVSLGCSFFDRDGRIQHKLASFWSWLVMKTILSPVTMTGKTAGLAADAGGKARVFAVTHASALDIPMLYVYLPFQFRIVFKSELLHYPFVGWHLRRSGQVCINQQNPSASIGAIKSALKSLRKGMPLVIFPEGGRTRDGQLQPFLPGAFFLAIKAQAEIVPIALVGTFDLLPMNTYHIKSQPLEMRVGEPVATAGLTLADTETVSARVKAAIEDLHRAGVPSGAEAPIAL
ncbi:MAG: lysophospholipid acyltransferase family protein [Terriglobales bacterium]